MQLTYDLSGLETSAEGGLHIHTGTSCTDSATVGGHLYVAACIVVASLTAAFFFAASLRKPWCLEKKLSAP